MKLYIGVTKNEELYYIDWDQVDNEQRKTFSLCGGSYNEPLTEEQGEEKAREVLESGEYWEDLGYLEGKGNNPLLNFIDFKALSDQVLNIDGWENINGEYEHFGEYEGEEVYLNYSSGGQHKEEIKDLKECWVNEEDLKKVYSFWDKQHLKPLQEKTLNFMINFFEKYKSLCSDEVSLIKYLNCIKWQK
jgi:hypothetical protein